MAARPEAQKEKLMRKLYLNPLQFDGDGAGTGASAGADGAAEAGQQGTNGAEEGAHAPAQDDDTKKEKADLKKLLKSDPELRAQYDAEMASQFNRRFKGYDAIKQDNAKYGQMAALLMDAFPDAPRDGSIDSLMAYLQEKSDLYADAAAKAGMPVDVYRQLQNLKRQNAQLEDEREARLEEERQQRFQQNLNAQIPEVQKLYPDFDLAAELQDPEIADKYVNLIGFGWSLKDTYESIHKDELFNRAALSASQQAARETAQQIKQGQGRPTENGMAPRGSMKAGNDPSKMSDQQIAEIAERVRRGEHISFS